MNTLIAFFCIAVAAVHSSGIGIGLVGPVAPGIILQGPSAKASLIGPDGSHIAAATGPAGTIVASRVGGIVAAPIAPVISAPIITGPIGLGLGHGIGLAGPGIIGVRGLGLRLGHGLL